MQRLESKTSASIIYESPVFCSDEFPFMVAVMSPAFRSRSCAANAHNIGPSVPAGADAKVSAPRWLPRGRPERLVAFPIRVQATQTDRRFQSRISESGELLMFGAREIALDEFQGEGAPSAESGRDYGIADPTARIPCIDRNQGVSSAFSAVSHCRHRGCCERRPPTRGRMARRFANAALSPGLVTTDCAKGTAKCSWVWVGDPQDPQE